MKKNSDDYSIPGYKPTNLVDLLRWRAETQPNTRAYTYLKDGENKEIHLTYGELDKQARAVAANLQKKGLMGERALLLYPPGLDYIIGFFGCLYADVIAVPAYPPDPNRLNRSLPRLQAIVNDARATIALTTDSILYMIKMLQLGSKLTGSLDRVPFFRKFRTTIRLFNPGQSAIAESRELGDLQWISTNSIPISLSNEWNAPGITKDSISFLQYTSGSTGSPKGVILTHDNLLKNSEIIFNVTHYSKNAEGVFWLPIYHDMGLIGAVLQPLFGEIPSTLMSPIAFLQRPLRWLEAISRIKDKEVGTAAPNFAYDLCVKKATPEKVRQLDLRNWRFTISGAEPVRAQTIDRFVEVFGPAGFRREAFLPAYGLAEATLLVSGADVFEKPVYKTIDRNELIKGYIKEADTADPVSQTLVSSGKNQPGQSIKIIDGESLTECKAGQIGEIWVKGPSVSLGYYNRAVETKETFHNYLSDTGDGPYLRTGDLGFMDQNELFVTGRLKDLIIIRGRNYYPQDIELIVEHAHPELRLGCSAAFSVDEDYLENLVVVAEVRQSRNLPFDEMTQAIRQEITEAFDLQVRSVILIRARSISKTSSGKIQRRATKSEFLEGKLQIVHEWHMTGSMLSEISEAMEEGLIEGEAEEVAVEEKAKRTEALLAIEGWLVSHLAEALGLSERDVDLKKPFTSYGLDSAQAVGMIGDMEIWLDRTLSPTVIWDYPNIESLSQYLAGEGIAPSPVQRKRPGSAADNEPIAIIGYSLRMPGAENPGQFWQNLLNGVDAISEIPPERWDVEKFYDPQPDTPMKMTTRWGGWIKDVGSFDAQFFGISPREAIYIDPQQRLLLETTYEALEDAGISMAKIANTATGVYVGISSSDYSRLQSGDFKRLNAYAGTGNAFSIAANRISYVFDLKGPSFPVDTACSSSLVAVHNAVVSLRRGESDMAIAAGVNLILAPDITITFSLAHMLAADGRCKTFDDSADGYVRGEGVGVVVLKRLSEALKDGDHIRAIIRGSAINQDGRSNGITAPNGLAQQACIRQALDDARLNPSQIGYLEAHGTGTSLGDPIEVNAMKSVMYEGRNEEHPLYVGSVKANIGHLESAAGISGLLKTIMVLEQQSIPKLLHFKNLNKLINLDNTNIHIATENRSWQRGEAPRFAGVSAYGFGGANAHIILQEAPDQDALAAAQRTVPDKLNKLLLPLSAHNPDSLRELAKKYAEFIAHPRFAANENIIDLIYSAGERRTHLDYRLAVIGQNQTDFVNSLQAFASGEKNENTVFGSPEANAARKTAFVFSGQGPQWFGMGRQLIDSEPVFRETIQTIDRLLSKYITWSLMEELMADEANSRLAETEVAQPAIFALQVALARLWEHRGIKPSAVVGHSVGEVAAAHIAGVLNLTDSVQVIFHRSRLMQQATGFGKMASVELPVEDALKAIRGYEAQLGVGAHNSPTTSVLSGEPQALAEVVKKLEEQGVFVRMLRVNYAFHSPHMDPYKQELIESLEGIRINKADIPIYSTVSGAPASATDYNPLYWSNNIRERVRFADAALNMIKDGYTIFVELSPHPVLSSSISQCLRAQNTEGTVLASIKRQEDEIQHMLHRLGTLYCSGMEIAWLNLLPTDARYIPLPTMVWNKERYWFQIKNNDPHMAPLYIGSGSDGKIGHPLLGLRKHSPLHPGKNFWEHKIDLDELEYMRDHKIQESVIFPATAYLEMALAVALDGKSGKKVSLEDVSFFKAMFLSDKTNTQVQFILAPYTSGQSLFQIFSPPEQTGEIQTAPAWNFHGMGKIMNHSQNNGRFTQEVPVLAEIQARCTERIDIDEFFEKLKSRGLQYGSYFKGVKELHSSKGEALALVELHEKLHSQIPDYTVHPALFDACLQALSAAIPAEHAEDVQDTFIPVAIKALHFHASPGAQVYSYARLGDFDLDKNDYFTGDIQALDMDGKILIEILGLKLQRLGPRRVTDLSDWFYRIDWVETETNHHPVAPAQENERGSWLIFNDKNGLGLELAEKIKTLNHQPILIQPGADFAETGGAEYQINPVQAEDYQKLITQITNNDKLPLKGVVHLWSLDVAAGEQMQTSDLSAAQELTTISALHLLKALMKLGLRKNPGLYLITRMAINSGELQQTVQISQSPLWGLGRVISSENPELFCRKIDLDEEADAVTLINEITNPDREDQIIYRQQKRLAARLTRSREDYAAKPDETTAEQLLTIPEKSFRLQSANPGVLGSLRYVPVQRISPQEGQVELEVQSAGLNFRDVLMALGLYPGGPIPFGSECSGIVTRVGEGVTDLKAGDAVIGIAPHSFGSYVTTLADLIVKKPDNVSFDEGATIPITFLTAYYAMHYLGRLQKGERILIHAGAGGVGQAAIQIAQMIGAEIYATAGSEEKQNFLHNMGIKHIYSSRNLEFADQIMEETDGQGVDIVLNSLAGEFIPRSLTLLKSYGRFLEIGKTDIYQNSQIDMYPFRNNLSYFAIDLDMASRDKPALIRALFLELIGHFEAGRLKPLIFTRFASVEAVKAFRFMAQRKNIGKIVVSMKDTLSSEKTTDVQGAAIRPDATYLITGGTGTLGLILAEWFVSRGARHLVLTSRRSPDAKVQNMIDSLQTQGVVVTIARGDVASSQDMETVFKDIAANLPPLKGVIHAAGLLDDHALLQMDAASLSKVADPKIQGSWILHQLTRKMDLDFFVFFSSVAAIVGNPGQGNYAAANIFMDMLAHHRRAIGLPALSINWGLWAKSGMVHREDFSQNKMLLKGSRKIKPELGLTVLARLLESKLTQISVSSVVWPEMLDPFPSDGIPPLYLLFKDEKIIRQDKKSGAGRKGITRNELNGLDASARLEMLTAFLQNEIARVVGVSASKLEPDRPLNAIGLDSLMAIELKNAVESNVDAILPIATLLKGPSIKELAANIVEQIMEAPEQMEIDAGIPAEASENPLSYGQKAMYFQHQLASSSIYNQVYAVRIPAKINLEVLRRSMEFLCRRHESLRTNFAMVNGQPAQIVHDEPQQILHEVDAAGYSEDEIHNLMREQIDRPFDLEHEALTRIYLFSKSGQEHIFLFVGHHIISDMWSLAVFMYELDKLYRGGGTASLPAITFTYREFARRQIDLLRRREGQLHLDYWKKELQGELPLLNLPTDRPRPAIQTYKGEIETTFLKRDLVVKLNTLAKEQGTTLYTLLFAAFKVLLYRYTGQNDIIVGTPTYGRTSPEVAAVLGYFVNPIAVRSRLDGQITFRSYLQRLNEKVVNGLDHQDYPFSLLVEKLHPRRDPSRTPIFQLIFVYQKAYLLHESGMSGLAVAEEGGKMQLGGVALESIAIGNRVLPFDITMLLAELDEGMGISLQYNTDLFHRETAQKTLQRYVKLIAEIAENVDRPIAAYQMMSNEEYREVIETWNQTAVTRDNQELVHRLFEVQAAKTPEKTALFFNGQTMTYRELNEKSNQLARYLQQHGVGADMIIGVSAERTMNLVIAMMAVLKAGAAYLPLDPAYPKERLSYMLKDSNIPFLLTQKEIEAHLPENTVKRIYIEEALEQVSTLPTENLSTAVSPENLVYVIYTSGSTGHPKGVLLTHKGLCNLVHAQIKEFAITEETRLLQFASFSFDAAASEIFTTLLSGATLYLVESETLLSGPDLIQFIRNNQITTSTLPPSVLRVLAPDDLSGLQTIISAGEACSIDLAERWAMNRRFINAYGPTEGTICASCYHVQDLPPINTTPIGSPIDNVQVYVLDEFLNPVPAGIPGELYIGGQGVARGYLNRPDLTAEKFIPNPFIDDLRLTIDDLTASNSVHHSTIINQQSSINNRLYRTGDLVRWLPDGNLEFMDRIDQQVKIRGFRIELGEIESVIKTVEGVKDAAVIAYGGADKKLAAYVISGVDGDLNSEDIKYVMRRQLPEYMIPALFIPVKKFPLTANGKVDYKALPKPDAQRVEYIQASNDTEQKLIGIWQEVLQAERIGINDNFFDLGGHSLSIIQIQNRIKESFERQVNVVDIFRYPTVSSFAKYMNEGESGRASKEQTELRASKQKQALTAQRQRMMNRRNQ